MDSSSPEKKLTAVALRLAILEKAASGIGALGFIWATVVLLGGFAITLERKDFWFVTVILLVEGARIFSRSHELEWQHQATWSLAEAGALSFRAIRSSSRSAAKAFRFLFSSSARSASVVETAVVLPVSASDRRLGGSPKSRGCCTFTRKDPVRSSGNRPSPEPSLRPHHGNWLFISGSISRLLYWLQLLSACACAALSLTRLSQQDYGDLAADEPSRRNRRPALNIFYGLALSEALLFLAERAYWEWKISRSLLLEQVCRDCNLGPAGLVSVRRFFYDAYSLCINGSIFDGIKMDMVSFAEELLVTGSRDEQRIGVGILLRFWRRMGREERVMERLVEMLGWEEEEEVRRSAAVVVAELAGKERSLGIRVLGIKGAMESISSLLRSGSAKVTTAERHSTFNLLGLRILKRLAKEPDNCARIGETEGLVPRIVDFIAGIGRKADLEIRAAKRALGIVKLLAGTTGRAGEVLRREISEIVFTFGSIREILKRGGEDEMWKPMEKLGAEIIACLAMDEAARESIGATGGMVRELMRVLLDGASTGRVEAGEALAMLLVESERNCCRVLRVGGDEVVERLVEAVGDSSLIGVNACRILTCLCAYGDGAADGFGRVKEGVIKAFPRVLLDVMMLGETKQLEVSIGFVARIVGFMSPVEFVEELERADVLEIELIKRLVHILQKCNYPSIRTPGMRRYVIELSIWLMQSGEKYIKLFNDCEMGKELQNVAETTTDLECFMVFSGYVGLARNRTTLASLVDIALELLVNKDMAS